MANTSPIGHDAHVEARFSIRDDGQVDAVLVGDWPLFNHALGDSISSLPPSGAPGYGPSTYWVDVADHGARRAAEAGDESPFIWGNITTLRIKGGQVVANYDYDEDDEPGETLALDDFLRLLADWRSRVIASAASSTEVLPETYRRNPHR